MIKRNLKRVFLAVVMVMTAALSAVAEEQATVTCTAIEGTSGFNNNESYAKLVDGDTKRSGVVLSVRASSLCTLFLRHRCL